MERIDFILPYFFYRLTIDPLLVGVRKMIGNLIEPNKRVVDIGCGTGELVFYLSRHAKRVIGVDINSQLLEYAKKKGKKYEIGNVEFISRDVNNSDFLCNGYFDYAILCMVLHQFSLVEANQVLKSIKGLAKFAILADFHVPLPKNGIGFAAKLIERIAGGEHYIHFKDYQKEGGLKFFLDYHRLAVKENQMSGLGAIRVIKASLAT